jgi:flagellar motor protein MotB
MANAEALDSEGDSLEQGAPVWAVFGDLMAGLLGAFVLLLVCVLGVQMELVSSLETEVKRRQAEESRRQALEKALAVPLAAGRVTLVDGRIGISGSVLFALNSDQLQPEGRQLLKTLAPALRAYLGARDELLMVSGFTDDKPMRDNNRQFVDNWELSAQRALNVTRALIEEGLPAGQVFSAAFGPEQPVASNADAAGRARNRRVEMAPVPRVASAGPGLAASAAR